MKRLLVWAGPVSSLKTTKAVMHAKRAERMGEKIALFRPTCSVRQHERQGLLVARSGLSWPSIEIDRVEQLIDKVPAGSSTIWIDEPMLFPDEHRVYEIVQKLRRNVTVMVSGCPATSELEPFGSSFPKILAVADDVEWCKADCDFTNTQGTASRSVCLKPKKGPKLVGGEETYKPATPEAWTAWWLSQQEVRLPT